MMNRRNFILTSLALGASCAFYAKPDDMGKSYNGYFSQLNLTLKNHGAYVPSLLVDLDILDDNIQQLKRQIPHQVDYRIVAKSLPSPQLLGYVMEKADTNKLMVFHQPFLSQLVNDHPNCDILMGKPMPVKAAAQFYQHLDTDTSFDCTKQLQWLIDSKERLNQYLKLAQQQRFLLQVNLELDVGLHRGGLQSIEQLDELMAIIQDNPNHLRFSGFMGYDAHVVKLPSLLKSAEQAFDDSQAIYQRFITRLYQSNPKYKKQQLCFNGAGSPTLTLHKDHTVINDICAGSCLVKPIDFDVESLALFKPAAFIATPVLKKMAGTELPAAEGAKDIFALWDANMAQTFFIYGGQWMAKYYSPEGLQDNALYGASTNQSIVNGSANIVLDVDDYVFLRPTQSEAVFLQFGGITVIRKSQLLALWPILKES
jgi:D-serine deaminase-like pyridoxal phosphate-dependent protein